MSSPLVYRRSLRVWRRSVGEKEEKEEKDTTPEPGYVLSPYEEEKQCRRFYKRTGRRFSVEEWRNGEHTECPCAENARMDYYDPKCQIPLDNENSVGAVHLYLQVRQYFVALVLVLLVVLITYKYIKMRRRWVQEAPAREAAAAAEAEEERKRKEALDAPPTIAFMVAQPDGSLAAVTIDGALAAVRTIVEDNRKGEGEGSSGDSVGSSRGEVVAAAPREPLPSVVA